MRVTFTAQMRSGATAPWMPTTVGALGDANWIEPSGEWTYGRFQVTSLADNVVR